MRHVHLEMVAKVFFSILSVPAKDFYFLGIGVISVHKEKPDLRFSTFSSQKKKSFCDICRSESCNVAIWGQ